MKQALSDLRVVELAGGVAGAFCARVLADLGATVLKVEPPAGDPLRRYGPFPADRPHPARGGLSLALDVGKLGATLDPEAPADRAEIARLCAGADVLVESLPPEARWITDLRSSDPGLVVISITPFGRTGPCRDWLAGELGLVHASGIGYETPFNQVDDPESQPPLKPFGHQAKLLAGWTAAAAALAALRRRDRSGDGALVDVSELEAAMHAVRPNFAFASHEPESGSNRARLVRRRVWGLPWIYRCADGWVSVAVIADSHWRAIREMMGDPEWARSPLFDSAKGRYQNSDALRPALAGWIATQERERLYREGQARHVPVFPLNGPRDLLASRHLTEREFFRTVEDPDVGRVT
ncbi:MAG: CoA transferase, partial [Candidatus Binatia bacterium]